MKANKAPTKISNKYTDFVDIFLLKLNGELLEHMKINNHAIKLIDDQQLFYSPIYSLGPMELEILKTYIENNLANGFIKFSKSLVRAPIFFDKKLNRSLQLYIDYWSLNNLIIKNCYPLPLV